MKILFLTAEMPYPPIGGSKIRAYNIIRGLSARHEIHLCTFVTPEDEKHADELRPYCKTIETVKFTPPRPAAIKKALGLLRLMPDYLASYMSRDMENLVETLLLRTSFDILHVEAITMGIYGMRKKRGGSGRPFRVLGETDCISENYRLESVIEKRLRRKLFMRLQSFKMGALERKLYKSYDRCILVTESDRRQVIKRVGPRPGIEVVPTGVDPEFFSPGSETPTECPSAVFTGLMSYSFNNDAALYFLSEVYPSIKKRVPEFKIFFVGLNPSEKLKGFARRDENVVVTGYVPDIRPFVRRAWIYVSPLRYGTGLKDKILEAFAMGKAVAASTVSCEGIEYQDGRDALIADGAEATAERVAFLLENENVRKKLGENARRLAVEKYSWEIISDKIDKIYESIQNND